MPIKIAYDQTLQQKIAFSYSPHWELMLSLHVLYRVQHHGLHLQWAVQTKRQLDRSMIADLRYFGRGFREYLMLMDLVVPSAEGEIKDFEEEAAELASMSDLDYVQAALDDCDSRSEIALVLAGGDPELVLEKLGEGPDRPQGSPDRQAVTDLLTDPTSFRRRFAAFLQRYWEEVFQDEFRQVEPLLLADIAERSRLLRSMDGPTLLMRLSSRIAAYPDEQHLVIDKKSPDMTLQSSDLQSIILTPTYFGSPHLITGFYPGRFLICYDIFAASATRQSQIPPGRLVALIRAVGDEVRLEILKLVAEKRRSTQELSQILSITPPSVSRHLRILKEAGLVTAEGEGYYVFYSLVPDEISSLSRHLQDFLGYQPSVERRSAPAMAGRVGKLR